MVLSAGSYQYKKKVNFAMVFSTCKWQFHHVELVVQEKTEQIVKIYTVAMSVRPSSKKIDIS